MSLKPLSKLTLNSALHSENVNYNKINTQSTKVPNSNNIIVVRSKIDTLNTQIDDRSLS